MPQVKAKELFDRFEYKVMIDSDGSAHKGKQKECAEIVCTEMISSVKNPDWCTDFIKYWQDVKREIELL